MTHSPVPSSITSKVATAKDTMTFPGAIVKILEGKKVTKLSWENPSIYILLKDKYLTLVKEEGTFHRLLVSEDDMTGTDWIVVESK